MAVGVTAWAAAHRPPKARAGATGPKVAAAATPSVATPSRSASIAPPARGAANRSPAPSAAVAPTERSGAAVPGGTGGKVALCDAAFEQRSWTAVASTCAAAFEARPRESALAMRVAQAQHRRGHTASAADWARKALALDAEIPEAFVIVARAEAGAGHARAAADAYRRYLTLAPRGWHAAEARRALRAER
jgi:predicted TPR repeat methyltransferase